MPKAIETGAARGARPPRPGLRGRATGVGKARFEAVLKAAETSGLMREKGSRIGGRVSAALIEQAKKRTGIASDTDLIEFALANVALADDFPKVFRQSRAKVDPALKLGF